jgi:hypothetical protein
VKRVYIAGQMSGYPLHNHPAFDQARDEWLASGWDVISPADLSREAWAEMGLTEDEAYQRGAGGPDAYRVYLVKDITALATCTAIAFLPGSKWSKGATIENHFARIIELERYCALTKQPIGDELP